MKSKVLLPLLFALLFCTALANAQLWSGILSPSRAVDWSHAGVIGGIPSSNWSQCVTTACNTVTTNGPSSTAAQINAAIASAPANSVVLLPAGTYSLSNEILLQSNVVLRGAGPMLTTLQFKSGGSSCKLAGNENVGICGSFNWNGAPENLTTWTAGYAQGSTVLTLGSVSGLTAGQVLILDQANDGSDTGDIFVCDTTSCSTEGGSPGRTVKGVDRNQQQYVKVQSVNSGTNQVTVTPGIYMPNWRSSQTPSAWWANTVIQNAGLENLTLDNTQSNMLTDVAIWNAYNCWIKNVRSLISNRNHVWLQYSAHITVRDSYFYGTLNSATLSYGLEPWQSGDLLIENNILDHIVTPVLLGGTSGTVVGYNYEVNGTTFASNPGWSMNGPSWSHDAGTEMILVEGNQGSGLMEDAIHGTHAMLTAFRNTYSGKQVPIRTQQTVPIILMSFTRFDNLIGNVLGTPGYHTTYETNEGASSTGKCDVSIYNLGWPTCECAKANPVPEDPLVASTLMRWGNYDVVNGAPQWNSSEVPSGLASYANAVPANHNLPPSFYLSSQPSWWSGAQWPAAGPDVSGGSGPGGYSYTIPAASCYASGTLTKGILNFDASNCYGGTNLQPPQNLTATVK